MIAEHRKWWLLAAMSGVLGLIVLDETVVTVSLPSIADELGLSVSATHWVVNAYLLSFTCAVALAGRLGDHFSRRSYFTAGAALFSLAPLLLWGPSMPSIAIPVRRVQMNSVPLEKHGQASGINLTLQMLGGSMGLAAMSALHAETPSYAVLFTVIGVTMLLAVPVAMRTIERS